jgi:hypothetical protein
MSGQERPPIKGILKTFESRIFDKSAPLTTTTTKTTTLLPNNSSHHHHHLESQNKKPDPTIVAYRLTGV